MKALLIVDVQNDFIPGGALPVEKGDEIVSVINQLIREKFDLVVASKDWHPKGHSSFASCHGKKVGECITLDGLEQVMWPDHCIQSSHGAELVDSLDTEGVDVIVYKGTDPSIDSYSAFFDNGHRKSSGLDQILKDHHVEELYVVGLATDYCVKFSVLDAIDLGFKTYLIEDACRGVNIQPNDSKDAIEEMANAGATIVLACDLVS